MLENRQMSARDRMRLMRRLNGMDAGPIGQVAWIADPEKRHLAIQQFARSKREFGANAGRFTTAQRNWGAQVWHLVDQDDCIGP
ncbi:hypothetical protein GCM10022404_25890 [Celeribacter arenosi]|uniref:Uncharacterized protein n=1 Tax=Celeribacter arenosi TaxID=792649 RepID=A0ABP7KF31_9RHOB